MTGKRQSIKCLVTMAARRVLRALAAGRPRIDTAPQQGHVQARTQRAAVALEVVGRRLQAVVHMPGLHLPRPARRAGQQQRGGIGAAAQGHRQRQRGRLGREGVHGGVDAGRIGVAGAK